MNIFLYSSLGTGLITPLIILVVLAALLIAVLLAAEKAESAIGTNVHIGQFLFNQETSQISSQGVSQKINANPGQWGSYEKRVIDQPPQESACGGHCAIMWKPNKNDIA